MSAVELTDFLPFPFLLARGSHGQDEEDCCLVELASLQPVGCQAATPADLIRPTKGASRDDHDPTVCCVRAAFARCLNDSYPTTDEGRRDLTFENWRTACALKGTAYRGDSEAVAGYLFTRSMRDWWPPVMRLYARIFRESGHKKAIAAATAVDRVVDKMVEIGAMPSEPMRSELMGCAYLAALTGLAGAALNALAARAALAAIAVRDVRADVVTRAYLSDLACLPHLAYLGAGACLAALAAGGRSDLRPEIEALGKRLRSDMAIALSETCAPDWKAPQ